MDNIFSSFGSGIALLAIGPSFLSALAFIYIGLRLRDLRGNNPDPEIGVKTVYHFFMSLGIILILTGLSIILVEMMNGAFDNKAPIRQPAPGFRFDDTKPEFFSPIKRVGTGLILSGTLCSVFFLLMLLAGSNDRKFPYARRAFVGMRLAISGLMVLGIVTAFMVTILQKDPQASIFEVLTALMLVWGPTALIHLVLLRVYSSWDARPPRTVQPVDEPERRPSRFDDDD
jgi:hypothetical protein